MKEVEDLIMKAKRFIRTAERAYDSRQKGDYSVGFLIQKEEAEKRLKEAKSFLKEVEKYLRQQEKQNG